MAYNLTFTPEQWAGHVPFIDSAHQRFIRGGLTIDATQVDANRAASQGQAIIRDNKLILLQGSYISENPGTGLYEAYCPAVAAVAASLIIGAGDAAVRIIANVAGAAGNNIQVVFIDPGAFDQELHVTYDGGIIIVSLATGPAGAITSIANDVFAAINVAAGADVTADAPGTGLDVVAAAAMAPLAGGVDGNAGAVAGLLAGIPDLETAIRWRAVAPGVAGNAVTIAYVDPGPGPVALAVGEAGNAITVTLQTDAAGTILSTAAEVVAEVVAQILLGAVTLVTAELGCALGNGIVSAMAPTNLAGGVDAGVANILARYACILFEDVELQDDQGNLANAIVTGIDHGRVIAARLPLAPDATVRAALPGVIFK